MKNKSVDELLKSLDYCGYDPYYDGLRIPVVKEIERRLRAYRPPMAPVEDEGGSFICGNQTYGCGCVGFRDGSTGNIEIIDYFCSFCGTEVDWNAVRRDNNV